MGALFLCTPRGAFTSWNFSFQQWSNINRPITNFPQSIQAESSPVVLHSSELVRNKSARF